MPSYNQLLWTVGWNALTSQVGSYTHLWTGVGVNLSASRWTLRKVEMVSQEKIGVLLMAERELDPRQDETTEDPYNFLVVNIHNLKHDNLGKAYILILLENMLI